MAEEHEDDPPVDAAVVATSAASMDPTGTTLIATFVAGALGAVTGLGRRVVNTFGPGRHKTDDEPPAP
jgi:hypothetical protein